MSQLWRDCLEQAREDWRAGEGRPELYPLVAAIIFTALVAVGIVGPWWWFFG